MPLPERHKGEAHKDFIDRCMGDEAMVRELPDTAQRRGVHRQAQGPHGPVESRALCWYNVGSGRQP